MRSLETIRAEIEHESAKEARLCELIRSARAAQDHIRHVLLGEPIFEVQDFGPEDHQTGRDMLGSLRVAESVWREQHDAIWQRLHELHSELLDIQARERRLQRERELHTTVVTSPGLPPGWRITPGPAPIDQHQTPTTLPENIKLMPTVLPLDTIQYPSPPPPHTGQPTNRHLRAQTSSP